MSTYEVNGKKLPSVTTIISDCTDKSGPLTQWAANCVVDWIKQNCHENPIIAPSKCYLVFENELQHARVNFRDVSQEALDVGSCVHNAIETYLLTGKEVKIENDQAIAGYLAFLEFAEQHKMKTHHCELQVTTNTWAGTLDWEGELDDKLTVIDFKASKAIYPEYRYQVAAYRSATGAEANGILRLDKETGFPEYKDYSKTYEKDLAVFNAMVNLYFLRHPRIAKAAGLPF